MVVLPYEEFFNKICLWMNEASSDESNTKSVIINIGYEIINNALVDLYYDHNNNFETQFKTWQVGYARLVLTVYARLDNGKLKQEIQDRFISRLISKFVNSFDQSLLQTPQSDSYGKL